MQADLPGLARELRKETCPRRVIDAARRSIAAETPAPRPWRYVYPVAFAGLVLLGSLLLRWRAPGGNPGRPELVQQQANDSARAARQAQEALGLIGAVLLDAGVHSENVISDRAIPPLRNGLETAKNKIITEL